MKLYCVALSFFWVTIHCFQLWGQQTVAVREEGRKKHAFLSAYQLASHIPSLAHVALRTVTAGQMEKVLISLGFKKARQTGSHGIYKKSETTVVVPVHAQKPLKP